MNDQTFEVVTNAEHALVASKEARAVLTMWINTISDDAQDEQEAYSVGAVMTHVAEIISHLEKAVEAANA